MLGKIEDPREGAWMLWKALGDLYEAVESARVASETPELERAFEDARGVLTMTLALAPSEEELRSLEEPF